MNASSIFQRVMDYVLKEIPFARVYLIDFFIFSNSIKKHIDYPTVFFKAVTEAGLKLKIT